MNGARQSQEMVCSVFSDEGRQIARNQLHRHVRGIGHAAFEHALQERGGTHYAARKTERKTRGSTLHLGEASSGHLVVRRSVDRKQSLDEIRTIRCQLHLYITAMVD